MKPYERVIKSVHGNKLDRTATVLWAIGQTYAPVAGIQDDLYYSDPKIMLEAQLEFHKIFPETFTIPGLWPDLGTIPEASALGCEVKFLENSPPRVEQTSLRSLKEVNKLNIPDPINCKYTHKILEYLSYFKENTPKYIKNKFDYLNGHIYLGGPVELSAMVVGYQNLLLGMKKNPEAVKLLIEKVSEFSLKYLSAVEGVVGKLKRIILFDHTVGLAGENIFLNLQLPYINKIFNNYETAELKIYHNETNWNHLIPYMNQINCNVIHAGPKLNWREANKHIDKCIMGNLDPIGILANKSSEIIREEVNKNISLANRKSKFWFSTGGGMVPSTPVNNIKVMVEEARKHELN